MTLLRLLNAQGIAGLALGVALGLLLLLQKAESRHWKKESARLEQLHARDQAALAGTVANYRAAADAARAADAANVARVAAAQRAVNERTEHDYEARVAAARLTAERLATQRLRGQATGAAADPGVRASPPMPGLPAAASGPAQAAGADRLPEPDALTATEQAIQLDELIKWVRRQAAVDPNRN